MSVFVNKVLLEHSRAHSLAIVYGSFPPQWWNSLVATHNPKYLLFETFHRKFVEPGLDYRGARPLRETLLRGASSPQLVLVSKTGLFLFPARVAETAHSSRTQLTYYLLCDVS